MNLETNRLTIILLSAQQLKLLTNDTAQFEEELNCKYCGEKLEGILLEIFKGQAEIVEKNSENYLWHTFWFFKLKDEEKFIGSAAFKNAPDNDGQVEIGYGINEIFQNRGYTTEAVNAMCNWVLDQPSICKVIAETQKDNIESQRVLEKCNMKKFKETDECYWWELGK